MRDWVTPLYLQNGSRNGQGGFQKPCHLRPSLFEASVIPSNISQDEGAKVNDSQHLGFYLYISAFSAGSHPWFLNTQQDEASCTTVACLQDLQGLV